jgi:hypothetical protein
MNDKAHSCRSLRCRAQLRDQAPAPPQVQKPSIEELWQRIDALQRRPQEAVAPTQPVLTRRAFVQGNSMSGRMPTPRTNRKATAMNSRKEVLTLRS